ncbi:MAG: hypothetical protein ACXVW1_09775 [Nocardioides sp.]
MSVEHVPASGRVRLDAASFEVLAAWDQDHRPEEVRPLKVAGVLTPRGRPADDLAGTLATVRAPLCSLRVAVGGASGWLLHQAWLGLEGASLLLDLGDGRYDLFGTLPETVPAVVGRVVRLGPRRATERAVHEVATTDLEALWQDDRARRAQALDHLGGQDERWAFRAEMTWPTDRLRLSGRNVTAMAGSEGWWLARSESDEVSMLIPTTPTALWSLLIGLMPTEAEIAHVEQIAARG